MKGTTLGWITVVPLACGITACNPATDAPRSDTSATAADTASLAAGEHQWTTADGNNMPYTVTGEGPATVVLVHCWMCDRTFWAEQVPVLAERYRTIALDLPGHGQATAAREVWKISTYGEDVAGLIEALGLDNVVLVGHSMGGPVSLRAAALAGDRVRGIVAVDTLHDAEFEFSGENIDSFLDAMAEDYTGTCASFVQQMFPEEGAEQTMARVLETSCAAERAAVGTALIHDFPNVDTAAWMSDAGVPIRAVNAAGPNPTRTDVNLKYADFDAVLVDGVGHYLHMTRPEQFNPLMLQAIEDILDDAT